MDASFIAAVEAAEMAGLGVYARAVLGTARESDPTIVSLRLSASAAGGTPAAAIDCELLNERGEAVGGFGL